MKILITNSSLFDAEFIADNLREHDIIELQLSSGETPLQALTKGVERSDECYTVMVDDVPALMFGYKYNNITSRDAVIWMLATELIDDIMIWFLKESKDVIKRFLAKTDKLYNHVWENNTVSILWLKWLGFKFHGLKPYGKGNANFHYFELETLN